MSKFICDYTCRTVGECIIRYNIPDDWYAEFDFYDDLCPTICVRIDLIKMNSAIMALKLKVSEKEGEEWAGCILFTEKETVSFEAACAMEFQTACSKAWDDIFFRSAHSSGSNGFSSSDQ